jgi:hypothetical protein
MIAEILLFEFHARAVPLPRYAAAGIKEHCDQIKQQAMFTSELQSVLRLMVEFSKMFVN